MNSRAERDQPESVGTLRRRIAWMTVNGMANVVLVYGLLQLVETGAISATLLLGGIVSLYCIVQLSRTNGNNAPDNVPRRWKN